MDFSSLEEWFFKYRWLLLIVILGILLISFGVVALTRQLPWSSDTVEILTTEASSSGKLVVDIEGAVEKPGIYELASGARVEEILVMAGGLSASADREWVEKVLNRAAKLTDGQKIYVPEKSQNSNLKTQNQNLNVKATQTSMVNINSASQAELESLSGIGPVTAGKIIDGRPYQTVEELLTRKILGKSVFEKNKEKISVY